MGANDDPCVVDVGVQGEATIALAWASRPVDLYPKNSIIVQPNGWTTRSKRMVWTMVTGFGRDRKGEIVRSLLIAF